MFQLNLNTYVRKTLPIFTLIQKQNLYFVYLVIKSSRRQVRQGVDIGIMSSMKYLY